MNKDPYLSLNDDEFNKLSMIYKLLSSTTRLKIVCLLGQSEMSVGDICKAIDLTSSAVSHQLKELKQSKIVKFRKEAQTVYYSLDNQNIIKIFIMSLGSWTQNYNDVSDCEKCELPLP